LPEKEVAIANARVETNVVRYSVVAVEITQPVVREPQADLARLNLRRNGYLEEFWAVLKFQKQTA